MQLRMVRGGLRRVMSESVELDQAADHLRHTAAYLVVIRGSSQLQQPRLPGFSGITDMIILHHFHNMEQ